jgi:hypothetical protein
MAAARSSGQFIAIKQHCAESATLATLDCARSGKVAAIADRYRAEPDDKRGLAQEQSGLPPGGAGDGERDPGASATPRKLVQVWLRKLLNFLSQGHAA